MLGVGVGEDPGKGISFREGKSIWGSGGCSFFRRWDNMGGGGNPGKVSPFGNGSLSEKV
jgi:hypothetical protein